MFKIITTRNDYKKYDRCMKLNSDERYENSIQIISKLIQFIHTSQTLRVDLYFIYHNHPIYLLLRYEMISVPASF